MSDQENDDIFSDNEYVKYNPSTDFNDTRPIDDEDYIDGGEYEDIPVNGDLKDEMGKGEKKDNSYLITIGIIMAVIIVCLLAYWLYKRHTTS